MEITTHGNYNLVSKIVSANKMISLNGKQWKILLYIKWKLSKVGATKQKGCSLVRGLLYIMWVIFGIQ